MGMRRERTPRAERPVKCEKFGQCLTPHGEQARHCNEAVPYEDSAKVLAEFLCPRMIINSGDFAVRDRESPESYPHRYFAVCAKITETLANYDLSARDINGRFHSFQNELDDMIRRPRFENNGGYIYHIDARMVEASLPAFHQRALYEHTGLLSQEVIRDNLYKNALILQDFDGLYKDKVSQVGNKRTEIEAQSLTNYLALSDQRYFAYAALFHEDSSRTRAHNHDLNIPWGDTKISMQVKTADYFDRETRDGRRISQRYADNENTLVVIHDDLVNLPPTKRSRFFRHNETPDEQQYDAHDPDNSSRYIRWGAFQTEVGGELSNEAKAAYYRLSASERKALMTRSLIKVGLGQRLNWLEHEFLNDRALHLKKAIRAKIPK